MATTHQLDCSSMLSYRAAAIDASGIRRVFELGAQLNDPYNFSIGQPDFPVPDPIKDAAIRAIQCDCNGYTVTQGIEPLCKRVRDHLATDVGWAVDSPDNGVLITSGTCGGLLLAFMALMNPGDEAIIADPYFVLYQHLATLTSGKVVTCNTYPDCRLTAERVEPLINDNTKLLLVNSPGNPTGVVLTSQELHDLVDLCERKGVLLISDEIYDEFTYPDAREDGRCPSPARFTNNMLLVRGFGKSYACTGWRMGYAAGPSPIIEAMAKLQQFTFVCAPSIAQHAAMAAFDVDLSTQVASYQSKRDRMIATLGDVANIVQPGGAFYGFVEIPPALGMTGAQFAEQAIERNVLVIPGGAFSNRDTHIRISYAVSDEKLTGGLEILREMLRGG